MFDKLYSTNMPSHVQHNHSGSLDVRHSLNKGTGAELRGIAVLTSRCIAAYGSAIAKIDEMANAYADDIRKDEENLRREVEREKAEWAAGKDADESALKAIDDQIEALKAQGRNWFGDYKRYAEIARLESSKYKYEWPLTRPMRFGFWRPGLAECLAKIRRELDKKLAIASVTSDASLALSPEDAEQVSRIERGEWAKGVSDAVERMAKSIREEHIKGAFVQGEDDGKS